MSEMRQTRWTRILPATGHLLVSAVLLGLAFPPFPFGLLAFVAFIPLLALLGQETSYRRVFRAGYLWLFLFHCITVYWTGGFTHARDAYLMLAGGALLVLHPFFYAPALFSIVFVKRSLGWTPTLFAIPWIWVGWEYCLSKGEFSFPWLSIGNTQTYDLIAIQFADVTGVFGISLWVLFFNVIVYMIIDRIGAGEWKSSSSKAVVAVVVAAAFLILPRVYGHLALERIDREATADKRMLAISVIQPDIDPFEKWSEHGAAQLDILREMTNEASSSGPDLFLWPETAIPFYLFLPQNEFYLDIIRKQVDSIRAPLLSGIPDIVYYDNDDVAPTGSKVTSGGRRYNTFNASMLMIPDDRHIQKYAKSILVPFAEHVPYSEEFIFLNAMRWNLGLGGWGIGRDSTLFAFRDASGDSVKFASFICYESIYPGYVAGYVRRGAQFLTVITNDSWWGNTSGAYQHKQFATLRAIENRRWLVRCANGGISCAIDPSGRTVAETEMYTRSVLRVSVTPSRELTFFSIHGDWIAELSLIMSLCILVASGGSRFYKKFRAQQDIQTGKEDPQ